MLLPHSSTFRLGDDPGYEELPESVTVQNLKSKRELGLMRWAGLVVWQAHQIAARLIQPGATTFEVNAEVQKFYDKCDVEPLFLNYPHGSRGKPPFPAACCMSLNEAVVHGIPNQRKLLNGDILSLDTGVRLNGWCGDAAVTHAIGEVTPDVQKLLDVTKATLDLAIDLLHQARMWSEVADQMAHYVKSYGFSTVECFVGHGIGRDMHEDPQVPNFVSRSIRGSGDFRIEPGLVIAVEPMVNAGKKRVKMLPDHWTQVTKDGKPSAHFEHSIAMTEDGPILLSAPPTPEEVAKAPFPLDPEVVISW